MSDTLNQQNDNPFQAPKEYTPIPKPETASERSRTANFYYIFLKWLVVCAISAGPSFFIAMSLNNHVVIQIAAMSTGILLFVVAYTLVESHPKIQKLLSKRHVSLTAWIGYGSRIFASIVFPIGMFLDMVTGMVSISISSALFQGNVMDRGDDRIEGELMTFLWYLATTIWQGILMNLVLISYMLFIFGMCISIATFRQWLSQEKNVDEPRVDL